MNLAKKLVMRPIGALVPYASNLGHRRITGPVAMRSARRVRPRAASRPRHSAPPESSRIFPAKPRSQVFAVDVHPAVPIGSGVFIDHGTGLVVGETAVIGDNVSILHEVTRGDRHPKFR